MTIAPLFVKYQTKSENCYVYDVGTGEIVLVGRTVYQILDDFRVLNAAEIVEKYDFLGEANVRKALTELEALEAKGILDNHTPQVLWRPEQVICQEKQELWQEFIGNHRRLLILELTQECNLGCEYCCYGKYYPTCREHDNSTMSLDVARDAIIEFVGCHPPKCAVGFYGGEPLLKFELLRTIVFFAEELARQHGMETDFSITTNGTLLDDEKIHFLVEHGFSVLISLDGPKEMHDRYRVFRNDQQPDHRIGSHQAVMKNIERFVKLYPDDPRRGIALTITATSDPSQVNAFLKVVEPLFFTVSNYVRDVTNHTQDSENGDAFQVGVWDVFPCESGSCRRSRHSGEMVDEGTSSESQSAKNVRKLRKSQEIPDFCNWTEERLDHFRSSRDCFIEELCRATSTRVVQNTFPLFVAPLGTTLGVFHWRKISRRAAICNFNCRCHPGASRTFYSAQGTIYPCEKTETGKLFEIGHAGVGIDLQRARSLTEMARLLADCGNCVVKQSCSLCFAEVSELKHSGKPDALAFQRECRKMLDGLETGLKEYTTLMEMNGKAMDEILRKTDSGDWLSDVTFRLTGEQLRDIERTHEQVEESLLYNLS